MQEILQTLLQQDIYEWIGLLTGIFYVVFAAKEKVICWIFGIISCACIAYKDLTDYLLYADAGLQLFYVVIGFVGLYQWMRMRSTKENESQIQRLGINRNGIILFTGIVLSVPFGYLLNRFTDAAFSYIDSTTTIFSIIATLLLIRKYIDNWIYWIVIDLVYVYLFFNRGGLFFGLLMIIYTGISIFGFFSWSKKIVQSGS